MPTLLALFGPKQGLRITLDERCLIGRSSNADVQLLDAKVSREHCRLLCEHGRVLVEDLGSGNGTFVNGAAITKATPLLAGDELAVGDSLFVVDGNVDVAPAKYDDTVVCVAADDAPPVVRVQGGGDAPAHEIDGRALVRVARLGAAVDRAATRADAAHVVLKEVCEAFAPDRAFVLCASPLDGSVRPLCGQSQGAVVSISRAVLALVRERGHAVLLDDAMGDRALEGARSVVRHGLRSVMVAPLHSAGRVAGFIHVDKAGAGAFGPRDLAALEAFAALAGLAGITGSKPDPAAVQTTTQSGLVGESRELLDAVRLAQAAARADSPVLITGESGTGKEELARIVHNASPRASGPFVAINCGAIVESLAESVLFGHVKGAFTGAVSAQEGQLEAADGGTLFLDEVGDLPSPLQVKLLRVLQERVVTRVGATTSRRIDVRVISATHRDLDAAIAAGRFRQDLFYRLNVLRIHLPPLRERLEDLGPIAEALLARIAARMHRAAPALLPSGRIALARWRWPGNVRELGNVLERLLALRAPDDNAPIDGDDVQAALGRELKAEVPHQEGATLGEKIESLERREIEAALRRARGVKTQAARALGISRPTLDKKIEDLKIDLWA